VLHSQPARQGGGLMAPDVLHQLRERIAQLDAKPGDVGHA